MYNANNNKIIKLICGPSDNERKKNIIEILSKKHGYTFESDIDDTVAAYIVPINGFSPHSLSLDVIKTLSTMGASIKPYAETNEHYLYIYKSKTDKLEFKIGLLLLLCGFITFIFILLKIFSM